MNENVKTLLIGVIGGTAGAVVGAIVTKKVINKSVTENVEKRLNEAINTQTYVDMVSGASKLAVERVDSSDLSSKIATAVADNAKSEICRAAKARVSEMGEAEIRELVHRGIDEYSVRDGLRQECRYGVEKFMEHEGKDIVREESRKGVKDVVGRLSGSLDTAVALKKLLS